MFKYLNSIVQYLCKWKGFLYKSLKNNKLTFHLNYKNKRNDPKIFLEDVLFKDLDSTNSLGVILLIWIVIGTTIFKCYLVNYCQAYTYLNWFPK